MSGIALPKSIVDGLDRASRSFLWGSSPEKKKQHLVAWDKVCLTRGEGGLGIRQAQKMNKALLSKLGWRLIHDEHSLWAKVLRSKYKVTNIRDQSWLVAKRPCSSMWRSVKMGLKEVVLHGMKWIVGDGRDVCFWADKWLSTETLSERAVSEIPSDLKTLTVRDVWNHDTGWLMDSISPFVTPSTCLELAAVVVDTVTGARDRLSWGYSADGKFTVKAAYSLLTHNVSPRPDMTSFFHRVWRVVAPERVRLFLWLVSHQAIMTNAERYRRHIGDSSMCQVCKGGEETLMHILRDCPSILGIWQRIVPARKRHAFFTDSLFVWLYGNLGATEEVNGCLWSTLFAMGVWWSWKWRCGYVFGEVGKCRDRVKFVKKRALEVKQAHELQSNVGGMSSMIEMMIAWKPPSEGWLKLNTDGAARGNLGAAAAGGVLRDEAGRWCEGFSVNIGVCSAQLAELWGVYYGLCMAWGRRVRRLELEIDSKLVVEFLTTGINETHPLSFLVRLCHGFISRDWVVRVSHVYREANRLADGLANLAFSLPFGYHCFVLVPIEVESIVEDDVQGSATLRRIRS